MEAEERAQVQAEEMPELRAHRRYPVDESATLLLLSHGSCIAGRIIDLSESGCRLRTPAHFTGGIKTRVEIAFRIHGIAFRFGGVVEWIKAGKFVGLRFVDVPARKRVELCDVLLEAEADLAAVAAKGAAQPLPTQPLSELRPREAEKRVQAQIGLRGPLQPLAALPGPAVLLPAAAAESQVNSGQPEPEVLPMQPSNPPQLQQGPMQGVKHAGRDRRAQARLPIDTTADILLINVGSRVGGRIQDLSAGGCRIHTDERFPVGIYTRVETEFRLQGLPFRLSGVVQALHDQQKQVVGIRFLDMSVRKREQVEQLIKEMEDEQNQNTGEDG